ncbi:hypothetical protein [Leuconostoc gasicomitatum]|uniref:hypothetical protein n=1 Tax=Leuconostoc gasicomitatum TaxID=115778 RepID=UPI001CC5CEB6|nr:hypothetical protein [Leuconostoc gasicomitatum]MBZ5946576.1 hypothetical protein [Leuconostoc gasicomitatum]
MTESSIIALNDNYNLVATKGFFEPEISEFVADIYFKQTNFKFCQDVNELTITMAKEDLELASNSTVFSIYNTDRVCQLTARLIANNLNLPFYRVFGSKKFPSLEIYEFARYASTKKLSFVYTLRLFENMLTHISSNATIIAGIDSSLYSKFCRLGFPFQKISEPIFYLGSMTIPVFAEVKDIKTWLKQH